MNTVVTGERAGMRLDVFLQAQETGRSRSQIQKLIKEGLVTVNEKKVLPHHFLKEGDTITLSSRAERREERDPDVHANPRVITETDEYIIIDKPAGMVVHPSEAMLRRSGSEGERFTLVDWLLERYPTMYTVGADPVRPGIVHRLDKDASGVMVIARTQESFESLVRQFKLRQIKKEYQILVYGQVTPRDGVIDLPIGRSKQQYTRRAAHATDGRPAVTRYAVLNELKGVSLVRVAPETGRTHQIRVHFFAKGNPVVGDRIYYSKKRRPVSNRADASTKAGRLMLHAERLGFRNLSGEWQEYYVSPDEDFQKVIESIPTR